MGTTSQKLTYLNETKSQLKETINYAGAGLTDETFRQYPEKLYDKYLDILKDNGEELFNGLPKVTNSGTSITLNGTANTRMKMSLRPSELEQETTTGKNLCHIDDFSTTTGGVSVSAVNNILTINGTTSAVVSAGYDLWKNIKFTITEAGYYKISVTKNMTGLNFGYYKENSSILINTSNQLTEIGNYTLGIYIPANTAFNNFSTEIQIEKGQTATDFEPYTGGIPAPNPEFPMDIHTISGDNEIKIDAKNIINKDWEQKSFNFNTGALSSSINSNIMRSGPYSIEPNKTYTFSCNTSLGEIAIFYYQKDGATVIPGERYIGNENHWSFTTPANAYYVYIRIGSEEKPKVITTDYLQQLERGNVASQYQKPQIEQSLPLNLPVENLLNVTDVASTTTNGVTYYVENQTFYLSGTNTKTDKVWTLPAQINNLPVFKVGEKYTFKINGQLPNNVYVQLNYKDSNNTSHSLWSQISDNLPHTLTIPNDYAESSILFVGIRATATNVTGNFNVQLEEGTKANSFTPYGTTPLEYCKIGNYEDEFILTTGSNKFNTLNPSSVDDGVTTEIIDNNNVVIKYNGTSDSYKRARFIINNLKQNTNYSFKAHIVNSNSNITSNWLLIRNNTNTSNIINTSYTSDSIINFNSGDNTSVIFALYALGSTNATSNNATWSNIQLNENDLKDYEPYGNGEWYLKKNILKHTIIESDISLISNFWYDSTGKYGAAISKNKFGLPYNSINRNSLCSVSRKINGISNIEENTYIFNANNNYVFFFSSEFDTVEHANAKLVGADVYYNISTPEYILLNDTLQSQLDEIYNWLKSYQEQTNISQVNNDLPFIISASAIKEYELNEAE